MSQIGVPLVGSYDYRLVALSIFIAISASCVALDLDGRVATQFVSLQPAIRGRLHLRCNQANDDAGEKPPHCARQTRSNANIHVIARHLTFRPPPSASRHIYTNKHACV